MFNQLRLMQLPNKQECFYILEMLESSLITFHYTEPWADAIVSQLEKPPAWLCNFAIKQFKGDLTKMMRDHIYSEPFESGPPEMEKFYLACLWLRYERRELSWATFLQRAGERLDAASSDWACETPYHYLNLFEGAYFSERAEQDTKRRYLAEHDLKPWIEKAEEKFAPFKAVRRAEG